MSLDIQFKIYSTIEDLENIFLGQEIAPNIFVERIFYETEYYNDDDTEEPEPILQERSRTRKRIYDYTKDLTFEFGFTSLNYVEFDSANWNHLVYGYLQWFSEEEISNCLKRIDVYLEEGNIDLHTKQFSLTKLLNQVKYSIEKFQKIRKQNYINEPQKDLLDVFLQVYDLLLKNLQSQKYQSFLQPQKIVPTPIAEEVQEISNNNILNTEYYKKLLEIDFIRVIEETYPNPQKIIATIGRSKGFNGFLFDVQKEYFVFCEKIGLIKAVEKQLLYDAKQIGRFLADISSFSSKHTASNFKRYYEAKDNPNNPKHYASNDNNVEKIQFILAELSKK